MASFDDLDFYTDLSIVDDPHPYFTYLRGKCPVVHLPQHDVMAVTTYEETARVLRDHASFSSCNSVSGPFPGFSSKPESSDDANDFLVAHRHELPMHEYVITMDPPAHQMHRGLVMRLLTPRRMRENEEYMWALADRQIDQFIDRGKVEVLHDYGQAFALLVIADLLGVPEEDHREFQKELGGLPKMDEEDSVQMSGDPLEYLQGQFAEYVEARRVDPTADVLTKLATATYPDGSTPELDVICRMATFLFAAGQDTTAKLITIAMLIIAEHPEIQAALRADTDLIPNFVEEVLRYHGIVKHIGRTARVTTEVAGVTIPAGASVGLFPSSANRDPAHFENPDEFQLHRPNASDNLAFGRGVHSCPGASLSRLEAKVSIERFLARTTDIRIDAEHHGPPGDRHFEYEPIFIMQGLNALHLEFDAVASDS